MPQTQITERQQYWRDHVLAAAQYEGSIVERLCQISTAQTPHK